jgi:hypothetical protein
MAVTQGLSRFQTFANGFDPIADDLISSRSLRKNGVETSYARSITETQGQLKSLLHSSDKALDKLTESAKGKVENDTKALLASLALLENVPRGTQLDASPELQSAQKMLRSLTHLLSWLNDLIKDCPDGLSDLKQQANEFKGKVIDVLKPVVKPIAEALKTIFANFEANSSVLDDEVLTNEVKDDLVSIGLFRDKDEIHSRIV